MGASLLAKAAFHSTSSLNDTPLSRADSLPQGVVVFSDQSSAFGSRSGNITSVNPNLLKSVMRDGYNRPIR
ncbi:hypothetical protein EAH72_30380 [Pseudomonas caspiana]|uniref:Uncharacterized protein n=1 Tax=Pseudomonas mandelii TaxID=75612 RepID=A0A502IL95_9PSED|nr:hypothetical protein EAH74_05150 [Pseudomonas mandelii]TPG90105.1 hypothetical protein EAH72_30380 [Pseudomonas caspiana]